MQTVATIEIVKEFAEAVIASNLDIVQKLLDDGGEFEVQDYAHEKEEIANKTEYLQWLELRLKMAKQRRRKLSYELDQCLYCATCIALSEVLL